MAYTLRAYTPEDIPAYTKYALDPTIGQFMSDGFPATPEACAAMVRQFIETESSQYIRAIDIRGEAVGCIGLFMAENQGEIAYWLGTPFQGRGVMSGALKIFCAETIEKFSLEQITAKPYAYNQASCRTLVKAGFQYRGRVENGAEKGGGPVDYILYAYTKP